MSMGYIIVRHYIYDLRELSILSFVNFFIFFSILIYLYFCYYCIYHKYDLNIFVYCLGLYYYRYYY